MKCSTMSVDHPDKFSELSSMWLGRKCCWTSYRSSFPVLLLMDLQSFSSFQVHLVRCPLLLPCLALILLAGVRKYSRLTF
ncbi:hypothetical protein RchiOBHm_Chr2g0134161 [Rosa chinensis]|uniref:Uncharacterized protein n=1 Tax=Rosa chinensis TaxID=74649 RepID=A0A2P6RVS0_ROSCH|nr:hypothetical protein RchiOBHm_Chr2g0134161 [Rosa chinensis]